MLMQFSLSGLGRNKCFCCVVAYGLVRETLKYEYAYSRICIRRCRAMRNTDFVRFTITTSRTEIITVTYIYSREEIWAAQEHFS